MTDKLLTQRLTEILTTFILERDLGKGGRVGKRNAVKHLKSLIREVGDKKYQAGITHGINLAKKIINYPKN